MSSAILYVAIVAIWACVLIPRWLRRGTTATVAEPEDIPAPAPQRSPSGRVEDVAADASDASDSESLDAPSEARPRSRTRSREQSRRRMMAARRRLLLTLLTLEAAAVALTVLHLTAMWVLIPPTIMLAGYLVLLREASHADAERSAREAAAAAARSRARAAARARAQAEARRAAAQPAPTRRVHIPEPETDSDSYSDLGGGRDYAPGLAGKYDTSDSDVIDFAQYKRAVGD